MFRSTGIPPRMTNTKPMVGGKRDPAAIFKLKCNVNSTDGLSSELTQKNEGNVPSVSLSVTESLNFNPSVKR